jgi:hypothetical protein
VACLLDNIRTVVSRGVSVPDQLAVQEANSSWILNAVLVLTGALKMDLGYGSPVPGRGSITRGSSLRYEGKIRHRRINWVSNSGESASRGVSPARFGGFRRTVVCC